MEDMNKKVAEVIAAWTLAGERLGVRVVAPFEFKVGPASYNCIAYLPDFGGSKGMLLQATFPPVFATDQGLASAAQNEGYFISFINPNSYSRLDFHEFQEALKDWGFSWLTKSLSGVAGQLHNTPLIGRCPFGVGFKGMGCARPTKSWMVNTVPLPERPVIVGSQLI